MDKTRTNFSVLVVLRRDTPIPLHRQIETSIRDAIRAGRLPRGSPLPPSRVLAADLDVSRGVVGEAYQQLASEGYLASYAGGYTQGAAGPAPEAAGPRVARETPPRADPSCGRPAAAGSGAVARRPRRRRPTGAGLRGERRARGLRRAAPSGAAVIEEDYDPEHRYDRPRVGGLQGMAPDRVVYAGSARKPLAPGL